MGVNTFTMVECTSSVSPARLFKAVALDSHNLMPKLVPQSIKSIEFLEGDSTAVGCVKQINFAEGSPVKYVKNRVDELDVENCYIKYTGFEGGKIGDKLDCVVFEGKIEASGAGSHYKLTAHFHSKGDAVITAEDVAPKQEKLKKVVAVIEEYLVSNPQVYA